MKSPKYPKSPSQNRRDGRRTDRAARKAPSVRVLPCAPCASPAAGTRDAARPLPVPFRALLAAVLLLLLLTGCASGDGTSVSPELPSSEPETSASSSPEQTRPSESEPVSTGDAGAFLQFLRNAQSAQVFRLRDDRSGFDPLGRVADRAAFTALYDVFSRASFAPLDTFDAGADGLVWLSGVTGPDGRPGDIWIAPHNGGAAVLFEIDGVLPDQRFALDADMTSLALQILTPYLDASSAALLRDFSSALEQADAVSLAALTGGSADVYAALAGTRIECGGWSLREGAQSEYLLRVNVLDGGGLLPEGEADWLLRLGPVGGDGGIGVSFAAPLSLAEADGAAAGGIAAGLIRSLSLVFGAEPFDTVSALDPELLCEAILVQTRRELHTGDELYDFPGAEVRAIASARFGLENYSGEGLACYDSERDEYTLYGRGAAVVYELLEADGPEDGALRVTARVYADSACIVPERTLLYTFRVSEPDGCEIVSCEELF